MQPRILIVYTGGTIGMTEDLSTGALVPFSFDHLMKNVPKIGRLGFNLDHVEMNPPIDSSNMNPACWARIASVIADRYEDFDGFVVLHGTDTMAYTASALSFMLPGLAKPVVLTGSQLPIGEIREDGTENLITALQIAAARTEAGAPMVQEVAISFGRHLWRGNRATKVSSTNFGAFQSFNYPPLADMDLHIVFRERLLARPAAGGSLAPALSMDDAVSVVFLYPGITEAVLRPQLESKAVKAVVLRTFGAGNAPTESWFTELITDTVRAGKVVVNVTQCPAGGVEEKRYATGDTEGTSELPQHGVDLNGEFHFKVDGKGRMALPAKFRKVLSKDLVVTPELTNECVYVFETPDFNEWVEKLFIDRFGEYKESDREHVKLRRVLKSRARDVEVDASGRIMLSPEVRAAVGIDKEVVVVGNTGRFEIWDADRFKTMSDEVDLGLFYS